MYDYYKLYNFILMLFRLVIFFENPLKPLPWCVPEQLREREREKEKQRLVSKGFVREWGLNCFLKLI